MPENFSEIDEFLVTYDLLKLNQDDVNNLKMHITTEKIKAVV